MCGGLGLRFGGWGGVGDWVGVSDGGQFIKEIPLKIIIHQKMKSPPILYKKSL